MSLENIYQTQPYPQVSWNPDDLVDVVNTEPAPTHKGGAKSNVFLDQVTVKCVTISTGAGRVRCGVVGCKQSWSQPRNSSRLLRHLVFECDRIPADLHQRAIKEFVPKSPSEHARLRALKMKLHMLDDTDEATSSMTNQTDVSGSKSSHINSRLVHLLSTALIPPSIVETEEFKDFVAELAPGVHLADAESLTSKHIPVEASAVVEETILQLQRSKNLTLYYDNGSSQSTKSICSVHVISPDTRQAYLLEGGKSPDVEPSPRALKSLLTNVRLPFI